MQWIHDDDDDDQSSVGLQVMLHNTVYIYNNNLQWCLGKNTKKRGEEEKK